MLRRRRCLQPGHIIVPRLLATLFLGLGRIGSVCAARRMRGVRRCYRDRARFGILLPVARPFALGNRAMALSIQARRRSVRWMPAFVTAAILRNSGTVGTPDDDHVGVFCRFTART